ncbi:DUF3386 family protein [Singulisphaera sp. PoT]|uniref:DUF3386 family protein n=1 Tax=Singulisphaera sp. PoT TaxID=3411797 RepID=UPI003BF4DAFD
MNRRLGILLGLLLLGWGHETRAHFLFIRISPMAEAGRTADVFFSEQAEAGDPKFVDKIAGTKLWLQSKPGVFEPLMVRKGVDRLRASIPSSGSLSVIGECVYGVLARPNQTPFLLRHYPKAIAGRPEELAALKPRAEIPLEIQATIEGDHLRFLALQDGKPLPDATLTTVDSDLAGVEIKTGADGTATWIPSAPGRYSVYTGVVRKTPGQHEGKAYDEIREFATIAFAWPLVDPKGDAEAIKLFNDALTARAVWKDFPGFSAHVKGEIDGRPFDGKAVVRGDGSVSVQVDDPVARPWLESQLGSIAMHRSVDDSDTQTVLRFGDDDEEHPLGRLLTFDGGESSSSYRVKDQQIMVVNREMGKRKMTITVLDNERNRDGQYLPRSYVVHYWDAASGKVERVETTQERWHRLDSWDLPTLHVTTSATEAGLSIKSVTLSEHKLGEEKAAAK